MSSRCTERPWNSRYTWTTPRSSFESDELESLLFPRQTVDALKLALTKEACLDVSLDKLMVVPSRVCLAKRFAQIGAQRGVVAKMWVFALEGRSRPNPKQKARLKLLQKQTKNARRLVAAGTSP